MPRAGEGIGTAEAPNADDAGRGVSGGGGAKTDGGIGAAGFEGMVGGGEEVAGAGSCTAARPGFATIVRSARRGGGTGGAAVSDGTVPAEAERAGGKGITPVVADCATGGASGVRWVSCGIPAAAALVAPRPRPGSGTAPSLSRTPPTDGAGATAASGGRKGISV
ncbi:MAG TPA: hypothetical protein VFF12_18825 [Myxococcaceae bacterium]|nr:hypothetical protein [Myxococcaceae bacterium]